MLLLTRLASKLGTSIAIALPSRTSKLASLTNIHCRSVTPRREQRRWGGHVGGESVMQDVSLLQPFIGRWIEVEKENYPNYLLAYGIHEDMHESLLKIVTEITYKRDGDTWEISTGDVNHHFREVHVITFGEMIDYVDFTGRPMKNYMYQDGSMIRERHESWGGRRVIISVESRVIQDRLHRRSTIRGVSFKKIFERAR